MPAVYFGTGDGWNGSTGPIIEPPDQIVLPHWEEHDTGSQAVESDNITNHLIDDDTTKVKAQAMSIYQVALPIIFGLIIITGIIGNIMVFLVIATQRKLRTVTNFLLLNLAIADVAFLVICGPFVMAHYALDTWPLGDAMCKVIQYFLYVTCYVTIYTLVAVAVVRYVLMVRLSTHPCVKDPRYITYVILGIWVMSLFVNVPVPLTHGVSHSLYNNNTECVISCPATGRLFFSLFFTFAYAVPLLVVAVLYLLLVFHLKKNQRNSMINKQKEPKDGATEKHPTKTGSSRKNSHVTRVLVLVVMVFALCWFPMHVHLLWGSFGHLPGGLTYQMMLIVWHAMVFVNSALNPIVYHFFSSEFRENFKKICCSFWQKEASSSSASGSNGPLMKTSV